MKSKSFKSDIRYVCNKELSENEICIAIKGELPSSMQYELEDNQEDYRYLYHKDWCDLLSTIEVKENRKRAAIQIKRIITSKA